MKKFLRTGPWRISKVCIWIDTVVKIQKIRSPKMGPLFGSPLGTLLGSFLDPFGLLLEPFGTLWGSIWVPFGPLGDHLEPS